MGLSPTDQQQNSGEGFERVFDLVGGHGRFQYKLLFIVSLQLIVMTWNHISYAFMGAVPDHWCLIPELKEHSNWTTDQIKQISIPRRVDQSNSAKFIYSNCEYYHLNYASLLDSSSSFEEALAKADFENATRRECVKWDYDRSTYQSTVATEFDLVCHNRWMTATIQGSYMAGGLVGALTFGSLSDRLLGRRKVILISATLATVGGILASFATSYWMFLLFRMVIAFGVNGCMQNSFILMTEHVDKSYRAFFAMVEQVPFAIGYMLLPAMAYYWRNWYSLQLSFGLISLHLIIYYWILPDSPRWLATHGETQKALDSLFKIAKTNRLPKPNRHDLEDIVKQSCGPERRRTIDQKKIKLQRKQQNAESNSNANTNDNANSNLNSPESHSEPASENCFMSILNLIRKFLKSAVRNFANLMRTSEIRRRSLVFWWIFASVAMIYYGIVFSGNLTSDPYLLVFLGGLMEVPAYTVVVPFVSKLGRRPTTVGNFFLTGICMLALSRTPSEYEVVRIVLAMLAKLFVSSGFAIIYLLGAELYPTELRMTGLAVGAFTARIGAISAPYIVDLMQTIYKDLPTVIFGVMSIVAGFVAILLPETKNLEMSDKVMEIELHADEERARDLKRKLSWVEPDTGP